MTDAVTCQNCHGGMSAVGGARARGGRQHRRHERRQGAPPVDRPAALPVLPHGRRVEPSHAGRRVADGDATASARCVAFERRPGRSPRKAANTRFAENTNTLFRFSKGHGGVAARAATTARTRSGRTRSTPHNDNVAAQQLQGHSGTITECTACHGAGTLPLSLGGPTACTSSRIRAGPAAATALAKQDHQACAACHGTNFRGTVLSRTAAQRDWGSRTVAKGRQWAATIATTARAAATELSCCAGGRSGAFPRAWKGRHALGERHRIDRSIRRV